MNASLRIRLDDVTERWGVRVTTVEVREVNPPAGVLEAMTRQMSAERTRRAVITEAQGQREAAVTLAEGNRQAAILGAEGERQAAILRAEGLAAGLEKIAVVGRGLDMNTMRLQYLETLKDVGTSSPWSWAVCSVDCRRCCRELLRMMQRQPATRAKRPS